MILVETRSTCKLTRRLLTAPFLGNGQSFKNQEPGFRIVPLTGDAPPGGESKQRNMCSRERLDNRGSCTLDPDVFGKVLDVRQPCE